MTPKEKAKELYFKMYDVYGYDDYHLRAKKCALISVDEILDDDMYGMEEEHFEKRINYWEEVKKEIELL
jgi:hypothetical protein